jgi:hypothetical protein
MASTSYISRCAFLGQQDPISKGHTQETSVTTNLG